MSAREPGDVIQHRAALLREGRGLSLTSASAASGVWDLSHTSRLLLSTRLDQGQDMSLPLLPSIYLGSRDPRLQVSCLRSGLSNSTGLCVPERLAGSGCPCLVPVCRPPEAPWSAERLGQLGW